MNVETFFENFELLTDAPNSSLGLREIILQLAAQGKIVPQNPNDKPASELLERIQIKREKLIESGEIKEIKLAKITPDDAPYSLPKGWKWVRLGFAVNFIGGSHPPKNKFIFEEKDGYTRLIPEMLNPAIKLHTSSDKCVRQKIIAPVDDGTAATQFQL